MLKTIGLSTLLGVTAHQGRTEQVPGPESSAEAGLPYFSPDAMKSRRDKLDLIRPLPGRRLDDAVIAAEQQTMTSRPRITGNSLSGAVVAAMVVRVVVLSLLLSLALCFVLRFVLSFLLCFALCFWLCFTMLSFCAVLCAVLLLCKLQPAEFFVELFADGQTI